MSIIRKSIATTISMIMLVLSLTVVSATPALGKGNRGLRITGASVTGKRLATNGTGFDAGTQLRSAASGTRNPKGAIIAADFDYKEIASRRANQMFHGTSGDGEKFRRSSKR